MAGRMQNRFNMLIDVTVGGAQNLNKLASQAKKSALGMSGLNKVLKANNTEFDTAKQRLKDFAGNLKKVIATNEKLQMSQKALIEASKKQHAAKQAEAAQLKIVTAAIKANALANQKSGVTSKSLAMTRAKALATMRAEKLVLASLSKQTNVANSSILKHNKNIKKQSQVLSQLKKKINEVSGDYLKWDGRSKKLTNQTKHLTKTMNQARLAAAKLGKEEKKSTRVQKDMKTSINKTTLALKKQTQQFGLLTQRISNQGKGWAALRRFFGAVRNQILVLMFATMALRKVFNTAFEAARQMEAALKGLGTVAVNNGNQLGVAEKAAQNLANKGLITVTEAAAGLKNLLSAGYGMGQATKMMETLTDAAAFNRQGTLALGEAVVGATQGIKNQNSIMVDNAGITKNLSIMQKEYAAIIGTTAGKLDEAGKRAAIFYGIIKEGAQFAGDATKVLSTMEGRLAKLRTQTFNAAAALGNLLKPAIGEILGVFMGAGKSLEGLLSNGDKLEVWMQKSRTAGKQLAKSMHTMWDVFKGIIAPIKAVFDLLGGFIKVAGVFIKIKTAQTLWNAVTIRSAGLMKLMALNTGKYVIATTVATAKLHILNTETGLQVVGLKALAIRYKMASANLRFFSTYMVQSAKATQLATTRTLGLTLAMKKLWITAKHIPMKLSIGFIKMSRSIKIATGATTLLRAGLTAARLGIKALAASLGPLLLLFLAFEAVIWIFDKIFGASGRRKEWIRDQETMIELMGALDERIQKTRARFTEIKDTSWMLGITSVSMKKQLDMVRGSYKKLAHWQGEYYASSDAKDREYFQTKIDREQKEYDKFSDQLTASQAERLTMIDEYYKAKQSIINTYTAAEAERRNDSRTKHIVKNQKNYTQLLVDEANFNKLKYKMLNENETQMNIIARRLKEERVIIEEEHSKELSVITSKWDRKIKSLKVRVAREQAKAVNDTWADAIKARFDYQKKALDSELTYMKNQTKAELEATVKVYKEISSDAKDVWLTGIGAIVNDPDWDELKDPQFWWKNPSTGSLAQLDVILGRLSTMYGHTFGKVIKDIDTYNKATTELGKSTALKMLSADMQNLEDQMERMNTSDFKGWVGEMEGKDTQAAMEKVRGVMQTLISDYHTFIRAKKAGAVGSDLATASSEQFNTSLDDQQTLFDTAIEKQRAYALGAGFVAEMLQKLNYETALLMMGLSEFEKGIIDGISNDERRWKQKELMSIQQEKELKLGYKILSNNVKLLLGIGKETVALQNLKFEHDMELKARVQKKAAIELELTAMREIVKEQGVIQAKGGEVNAALVIQAELKIKLLMLEKYAWDDVTTSMTNYFENLEKNAEKTAAIAKIEDAISDLKKFGDAWFNHGEGLKDTYSKINTDHAIMIDTYKEQLDDRTLSQEQYNKLVVASDKLALSKKKKADKLAKAQLYKMVAQEILAAAAKAAIRSGNILAGAAILFGGYSVASYITDKARTLESEANRTYATAERAFQSEQAAIMGGDEDSGPQTSAGTRKFGGTIRAESLDVTISPTVIISGEAIFIGQGSVTEFQSELQLLILESTQQAIDNREIDLSGVMDMGA